MSGAKVADGHYIFCSQLQFDLDTRTVAYKAKLSPEAGQQVAQGLLKTKTPAQVVVAPLGLLPRGRNVKNLLGCRPVGTHQARSTEFHPTEIANYDHQHIAQLAVLQNIENRLPGGTCRLAAIVHASAGGIGRFAEQISPAVVAGIRIIPAGTGNSRIDLFATLHRH